MRRVLKWAARMQGSWASGRGMPSGSRQRGRLKVAGKGSFGEWQESSDEVRCIDAGRPGLSGGTPKGSDPPQRLPQRPRQMGPLAWLQSRLQPGRQQAMSRSDYVRIDFRAPRCASCLPLLSQALELQWVLDLHDIMCS